MLRDIGRQLIRLQPLIARSSRDLDVNIHVYSARELIKRHRNLLSLRRRLLRFREILVSEIQKPRTEANS